jgi:hypothetical protein
MVWTMAEGATSAVFASRRASDGQAQDARRWPLAALCSPPTSRACLACPGTPWKASGVLAAPGGLRAQPGQSELPAVGRF